MSTIVTRSGKGSPLTHNEVDTNFSNLNTDKIQSGNTVAALTITSATINGGAINNSTIGATTAAAATVTSLTSTGDGSFTGTGQVKLPSGTTAERSGSPSAGMIRYNSTTAGFEGYTNTWGAIGGGSAAAGSTTQIQYNNAGAFGASASLTFASSVLTAPYVSASGGFHLNALTVGTSYSIPSGSSASSVGPLTFSAGVAITVPSGSRWVVL
jgi:hypothetical protein